MPTFLKSGPYRFFVYSHEPNEPPHIHVDHDNMSAKFWLKPAHLARNTGYSPSELRKVEKMVEEHQEELLEKWNGYFGAGR